MRFSKVSCLQWLPLCFKILPWPPGSPELPHYQVEGENFEDFFKQRNAKMRRSGSHDGNGCRSHGKLSNLKPLWEKQTQAHFSFCVSVSWSLPNGAWGVPLFWTSLIWCQVLILFLSRLYPSERKQLLLFSAWRPACPRHTRSVWKPYEETKRRDPEPMLFRKGPDFLSTAGFLGVRPFKSPLDILCVFF